LGYKIRNNMHLDFRWGGRRRRRGTAEF